MAVLMPPRREIPHSRLGVNLNGFFPSRVRIERPIKAQNAAGEEIVTGYSIVYDGIPAAISAVIRLGEEWRNWRLEFVLEQTTHRIMLQGYYPDIRASDRLITQAGEIHNITARHLHSHNHITRMDTRIVSPSAIEGVS